jgi:hypothetical protein
MTQSAKSIDGSAYGRAVLNGYLKQCPYRNRIPSMRIGFSLLSLVFVTSGMARTADLALTGAKVYTSPTDPPLENDFQLAAAASRLGC